MQENKPNNPKIIGKWIVRIILILVLGGMIIGYRWAAYGRPPLPEAVAALESDDVVKVESDPWLVFSPGQVSPETGFIFYPGGRVDPQGYAPLMREIASEGYLVVVPSMILNMAPFSPNAADGIIANYPEIEHWVMGGHSVGAVMAAQYTDKNPEVISGLAIWASYPMDSTDISDQDIPVLSIYGSREVRVNDISVGERKHQLPADTEYVVIEGGDHHQFGSYLIKPEEHLATTSRASQQEQIVQATLDLLAAVSASH